MRERNAGTLRRVWPRVPRDARAVRRRPRRPRFVRRLRVGALCQRHSRERLKAAEGPAFLRGLFYKNRVGGRSSGDLRHPLLSVSRPRLPSVVGLSRRGCEPSIRGPDSPTKSRPPTGATWRRGSTPSPCVPLALHFGRACSAGVTASGSEIFELVPEAKGRTTSTTKAT